MTQSNRGMVLAVVAYLIWGFAALYWVETKPVSAADIIAHRALWSIPVLALVLLLVGRLKATLALLGNVKVVAIMTCSAALSATNWLIFVWAITHEQATHASLGYFLLPLINITIGLLLFGEKIDGAQKIAVALACIGVLMLVVENKGLPWVALGVALSFGVYGAVRKGIAVDAVEGLLLETLIMAPFALAWLWLHDWGGLGQHGGRVDLFLLGAGVMTAVPLMAYVASSRLTPLTSLGIVFYIGPSCQLFVAICLFGEPMNPVQLAAFALVWLGLLIVSIDALRRYRHMRKV